MVNTLLIPLKRACIPSLTCQTYLNIYTFTEKLPHFPSSHSHRSIGSLSKQLATVSGVHGQFIETVIWDGRIAPDFLDPASEFRAQEFVDRVNAPMAI